MTTQGGWGSGNISWFGDRRGAMALGGRWWLMALRNYPGLRLGVAPAPWQNERLYVGTGKATLINRNSPHRQEALNFYRFLLSEEYNALINAQADALGPVRRYSETEAFLHDPAHPEENYNAVWREVMAHAVPEETSLFVSGYVAARIIGEQLDLVKANQKSAAEALRKAAARINEEIRKTVAQDDELRRKYERALAQDNRP